MKIVFKKAAAADAESQLEIQHSAFYPLYEKYNDEESPANMTLEEMTGKIENPYGAYYIILADNITAGGIYAYPISENGEVMYLCSVYIRPDLQGNKLAQQAITFIHSQFPHCKKWVLEVPDSEEKNIHLYKKAGYVPTDEKQVINDRLTIQTYIKEC